MRLLRLVSSAQPRNDNLYGHRERAQAARGDLRSVLVNTPTHRSLEALRGIAHKKEKRGVINKVIPLEFMNQLEDFISGILARFNKSQMPRESSAIAAGTTKIGNSASGTRKFP